MRGLLGCGVASITLGHSVQLDRAAFGNPREDSAVCQVPGLWAVCLNFLD